jgi:CRISPR/Cas system-associated protein endoribonuclease Cas2
MRQISGNEHDYKKQQHKHHHDNKKIRDTHSEGNKSDKKLEELVASIKVDKGLLQSITKSHKHFARRHQLVSEMRNRHHKGRKVSEKLQRNLLKSALKAEAEVNQSISDSLNLFDKNKALLNEMERKILNNFDELRVKSNPVFFNAETRKTLLDMGYTMKDLRYYHNVLLNKKNAVAFRALVKKKGLKAIFERAKKLHKSTSAPESIEELKKEGVVTIEGAKKSVQKTVAAVTIAVGAVIAVVGAVVAIAAPPVGAAIATVGTIIAGVGCAIWADANGQDAYVGMETSTSFSYQATDYPSADNNTSTGSTTYPTGNYKAEYYANTSRSKREVHRVSCNFLHLIKPEHLQVYNSLAKAHNDGFDNCFYCIGGSTR